ncbi:MAG: class I SAM-dependent methyltransferase [Candidatus Omnitrophota bacterium]
MAMLTKLYYWLHRRVSKKDERGEYSSGYWQDKIRREALKMCRNSSGRSLEVGCGEGLFLTQLARQNPQTQVWGIDFNEERLRRVNEKIKEQGIANIHVLLLAAPQLTFEDEYFDTVVCVNVFLNMESLDTVRQALQEIHRVCKRSGKVIFDFRNSRNLFMNLKYRLARYYDRTLKNLPLNTYHPQHIESLLRELGFSIRNRVCLGFFMKRYAPLIIIEAVKV